MPCRANVRLASGALCAVIVFAVFSVSPGLAQKASLAEIMTAGGMPGSLGIAGFDALKEKCDGKRNPAFRQQMVDLANRNVPTKQAASVMKQYDRHYNDWKRKYVAEQPCTQENFEKHANPKGAMWSVMAHRIGFPDLLSLSSGR